MRVEEDKAGRLTYYCDMGDRDANCSGRLFNNLYLFWSEVLGDAGPVKLLTTVPGVPLLVEDRSQEWRGWFFTAMGVLCFSLTFPMTRLSLRAFDPIMVALIRGAGAGIAAFIYVVLSRSRVPNRRILLRLGSAAIGMVV